MTSVAFGQYGLIAGSTVAFRHAVWMPPASVFASACASCPWATAVSARSVSDVFVISAQANIPATRQTPPINATASQCNRNPAGRRRLIGVSCSGSGFGD